MSPVLCMISDGGWVAQAENLCRQIRQLGASNRICLLLLDAIPESYCSMLSDLAVEISVSDGRCWPSLLPRTGIKLWLPTFFSAEEYILLDSDLIILSEDFFKAFAPAHGRMKLVRESSLVWRAGKKGVSEQHTNIVGQPVLQTGVMSFERSFWDAHFPELLNRIENDPSEFGDMVAVNQFMIDNPQLLEPVSEEACLVLRPTGGGPSTRVHLPRTRVTDGKLLYEGKCVLSLHYTHSEGKVCTYQDISSMMGGAE